MENQENKKENIITRTTTIGEIVEKYPQTVDVLLTYGVHCVGCHVSPFESLEDGFRGHGLSEEKIDDAVMKLNKVVQESVDKQKNLPKSDAKITLAQNAVAKIKEFCSKNNKKALRIRVMPGGCSGYMYNLELVDEKAADEVEIMQDDVKIFIDVKSLEKMDGATIEYKDSLQGAGFKIINPEAKSSCGCGESFN